MTIKVKKLVKYYPNCKQAALKGVDLHILQGEFFGLLGPNGSGKTTLISTLTGILSATSGKIFICDQKLGERNSSFKRFIGISPQEASLYSTLSLRENLVFFASMHGIKGSKLKSAIQWCSEVVQLDNVLDQPIHSFSGGMRQRANIAASIIHKPKILFLDEPTVGVDPQSRNMIFNCLREFNSNGTTIIYTTHYMEEAEELCSRIAILDHGRFLTEGSPQKLIEKQHCQNLGELFLKLTGTELRD